MKKRMTVSEARSNLYELVEFVTETPDAEVVIEHRSRKGRAILVDEARYKYLETTLRELQKREGQPFRLEGSMSSDLSDDELGEAIDRMRREQAALAAAKFADL